MIRKAINHGPTILALAAGLIVAGGVPVQAGFFKDVEHTFVDTFTGAYEDARQGTKDVVRDANQALNGPDQSTSSTSAPASGGATYGGTTYGGTVPGRPPYASYPATGGNLTRQVQTELAAAGYNPGPADGVNGRRTASAIRAYQAANGLPQDGQVSQALLDNLRAKRLSAYNTSSGQPQAPVAPSFYAPPPAPEPAQPANPMQQQSPPPAPAPVGTAAPGPVVQQNPPPASLPALPGAVAQQQPPQQSCKPYEKRTMIDGRETVTTGTACLQLDGTWKPIN